MIADGTYGSAELQELADEKNINLVTTCLTGKDPDEVFGEFKLNEAGKAVITCPKGHEAVESQYYPKNQMIRAKMNLVDCSNCPFKERCKANLQKKPQS